MSNPKKPKKSASKSKHPPVISVDAYNALWVSYSEEPNVKKAATAAGVKVSVARWYCEGAAWPEIGFVQLAEKLRKIQSIVAEVNDHGTAKLRARELATLQEGLKTTSAAMAICQRGVRSIAEKVSRGELPAETFVMSKDSGLNLKDIVATHDKLLRLAFLTMGEADSAHAIVARPENLNFAEWTAEECMTYNERGIVPERFKK